MTSGRPTIVLDEAGLARFLPSLAAYDVLALDAGDDAPRLADARVLLSGGERQIDAALLDRLPALGLIANFPAGYEHIDLEAARARGIVLGRAIDANHEDVADVAIGLMIAQRRRIVSGDRAVREGSWMTERRPVRSLSGARLGVLGLGAIGAAIAARAAAMRMTVAWWGPRAKPDAAWPRAESLVALARDSDVLMIAAPSSPETHGLVSAAVIAALGTGGLLVNVSRGALVDEDALIAALRDGTLGGAALDVFATEPTPPERWRDVPNTVFAPHVGGATIEAVAEMGRQCLANVDAFFRGEPLPTPIG